MEFQLQHQPSNEYSGLISFRMDWLDLLAVQGTLKSLLQHHSSKASIIWHSAFFMVQLSHPYMNDWKNHSFDYMDLYCKVKFLLLICCHRLVIAFLLRSKCLLISWLQSPSAMTWRPKTKVSYCFHCFPVFCHEVMGPDAMTLVF